MLALGSEADLDHFADEHGSTRKAESAIRDGLVRAVDDAEQADAIGGATAGVLRGSRPGSRSGSSSPSFAALRACCPPDPPPLLASHLQAAAATETSVSAPTLSTSVVRARWV